MIPYCSTKTGGCGQPFQSRGLFDAHRVGWFEPPTKPKANDPGPRRCLTPDEMLAKGWRFDGKTWRGAGVYDRQDRDE